MHKVFLIFTISLLFGNIVVQSFAQTTDDLVILHTEMGDIVIEFFPNDAPNHVNNFLALTKDGFYDNTVFHRIIPNFMIQGGDPNTKLDSGKSVETWGIGDPGYSIDAEFNTIKHNRGIVSMARAQDPNSAGSQFFIIHENSNFLDEQYTVFGRIITQESFDTLDKIASVQTSPNDRPVNPESVTIMNAEIIKRSDISEILDLGEPERTESSEVIMTGSQEYESDELKIKFSAPVGWNIQEFGKDVPEGTPNIVVVGSSVGGIPPVIAITIHETDDNTLSEYIENRNKQLQPVIDAGQMEIILQELHEENIPYHVTDGISSFESDGITYDLKSRQIVVDGKEKFYVLEYTNTITNFDSQLPRFNEALESFESLSDDNPLEIFTQNNDETISEEGGGCLIATAIFGSELAPQVQRLREIRDNTLLSTYSGTAFISAFNQLYYSFSPTVADLERENPAFKELVKLGITPMLSTLSIMSFADNDSEEQVLGYGISIILLNIMMYLALPAIVIFKISKKF